MQRFFRSDYVLKSTHDALNFYIISAYKFCMQFMSLPNTSQPHFCMVRTYVLVFCLLVPLMLSIRPRLSAVRSLLHFKSPSFHSSCTLLRSHPQSGPNFKKEFSEKYFEFTRLEPEVYEWWECNGMFKPDSNRKVNAVERKPFVVPMPPPNVTGYLHMGHAIFVALQDIMARFQRMRGRPTLWLPGT